MPAVTAQTIVCDIEGTTTPIEFVTRRLFPFARQRMRHWCEEVLTEADRSLLREEYEAELSHDKPGWHQNPTDYLLWLMDLDRKQTGLKLVQGKIWQAGYESGDLQGELFDDVPPAFREWNRRGVRIAIFSSGSMLAQQLLFRYSVAGDLSGLIEQYFDTTTGPKREPESYRQICQQLNCSVGDTLFLSDIADECIAAQQAGLQALAVVRPGNAPLRISIPAITSFSHIELCR